MHVELGVDRDGDCARLAPRGAFDLAHVPAVARAVAGLGSGLEGCRSIDVDLAHLDRIDGAGAVLLARLLDRLDASAPSHAGRGGQQPGSGALDCPLSRAPGDTVPRLTPRARLRWRGSAPVAAQLPARSTTPSISPGAAPSPCRKRPRHRARSIGARFRGCSRRSARMASWSPAPPTFWWVSSSDCSASRSSRASARSPTSPSSSSSHSSGSLDRSSRRSSSPADRAPVSRRSSRR